MGPEIAPPIPELDPSHASASALGSSLDFDLDDLAAPAAPPPASVPAPAATHYDATQVGWQWQESATEPAEEISLTEPDESSATLDLTASSWEHAVEPREPVAIEPPPAHAAIDDEAPSFVTAFTGNDARRVTSEPDEAFEDETVFEPPEQITAKAIEELDASEQAPYFLAKDAAPAVAAEEPGQYSWEREPEARGRVWLWATAVLLLLLVTTAQLTLFFRQDLARELPAARPLLASACEQLGCVLTWPQVKSEISIEASDLHPNGREGSFELVGTLRNRADFQQGYPHLELTLTDVHNRALARKVLTPEQWLPAYLVGSQAFAASSDIPFSVVFEATQQPVAGFNLYAFYP